MGFDCNFQCAEGRDAGAICQLQSKHMGAQPLGSATLKPRQGL
eukprot:CAMPEP_0206628220 /NCGR_PEP_ID=MMETSP0325_2-20121206/66398_1 /ASSEMBLY_ACC=CAM_ASM_000347 /TAXON_ID=2866 /ORGANISM="Crypthecodinium cohnii, Strain Seligo" /LENGTH=42 /DNA_ID= /DNA_START= /DNA_END= /DNA_ORIENTATION=